MIKKISLILLSVILLCSAVYSQAKSWPKEVTVIENKPNAVVSVDGNLSSGQIIEDLSWAANSSNACFPATQNTKFRGNHVFFATTLPARSIMKISVKPTDDSANLSIYGYMIGATEFRLVPDLPSSVTCEADHKWDRPWKGKVQTSERHIEFQNPGRNTYNVLIGVSAPAGVSAGAFKLEVKLES